MQAPSSAMPSIAPGPPMDADGLALSEHLNVLLIEDKLTDLRLIEAYLGGFDEIRLEWVRQLTDAIAALQAKRFEVLLLDLSLPDARGIDLIGRLRGAAPGAAIIVLSAQASDDLLMASAVIRKGAMDFLPKADITPALLARSIRMAAERSRRTCQNDAHVDANHRLSGFGRTACIIWSDADDEVSLMGEGRELLGLEPVAASLSTKALIRQLPTPARRVLSAVRKSLRHGQTRSHYAMIAPFSAVGERDLTIEITAERGTDNRVRRIVALFREPIAMGEIERVAETTAAALAHKLRTPLTAVRGALGLLAADAIAPMPAPASTLIARALAGAERMTEVVTELLGSDRAVTGGQPLKPSQQAFTDTCRESLSAAVTRRFGSHPELRIGVSCKAMGRAVDGERLARALAYLQGHLAKERDRGRQLTIEAETTPSAIWLKLLRGDEAESDDRGCPVAGNEMAPRYGAANQSCSGMEIARIAIATRN
jgi:DNA-binding response OmpR family regulator